MEPLLIVLVCLHFTSDSFKIVVGAELYQNRGLGQGRASCAEVDSPHFRMGGEQLFLWAGLEPATCRAVCGGTSVLAYQRAEKSHGKQGHKAGHLR